MDQLGIAPARLRFGRAHGPGPTDCVPGLRWDRHATRTENTKHDRRLVAVGARGPAPDYAFCRAAGFWRHDARGENDMSMFTKATREKLKLRMTLDGPAGSGKTLTGLLFAHALAARYGGRVAVIDTEHGSARKYAGETHAGVALDFDVCELEHFAPSTYSQVIQAADDGEHSVLLIDSLSHAWSGTGGALDQVDQKAAKSGNSFTAWKDVTPQHNALVEAILRSNLHVITTMRSHMEYVLETDARGKQVPKKVGMKPIQRQGMEYEFDVICDLDIEHLLIVTKSRCSTIDGLRVSKPAAEFLRPVIDWLERGAVPAEGSAPKFAPAGTSGNGQQNQQQQSARSATVAIDTATETRSLSDGDPCTAGHQAEIKRLFNELGMKAADGRNVLRKRGAAKLADLTVAQAEDLIASCRGKLTQKEAAEVFG